MRRKNIVSKGRGKRGGRSLRGVYHTKYHVLREERFPTWKWRHSPWDNLGGRSGSYGPKGGNIENLGDGTTRIAKKWGGVLLAQRRVISSGS